MPVETGMILGIVLEGLKLLQLLDPAVSKKFEKQHHKILKKINKAKNKYYPYFSDAELALGRQELQTFYRAYEKVLQEINERGKDGLIKAFKKSLN